MCIMADTDDTSHGIVPGSVVHSGSMRDGGGTDDASGVGINAQPVRLSDDVTSNTPSHLAPLSVPQGSSRRATGGGTALSSQQANGDSKEASGAGVGVSRSKASPVTRLKLPARPSPSGQRGKARFTFGNSSEERKVRENSERNLTSLDDSDGENATTGVALTALNATPGLHRHSHSTLTRLAERLLPMSVLHAWLRSEVRCPRGWARRLSACCRAMCRVQCPAAV